MRSYLKILEDIMNNGFTKHPERHYEENNLEKTLALPSIYWSHDMSDGSFPLLTCRDLSKVFPKALVEMEGFLKGITSKKWYSERNCPYWDLWCNPQELLRKLPVLVNPKTTEEQHDNLVKKLKRSIDDLGPIYGAQLRRFGESVDPDDCGVYNGCDQLSFVLDTLKSNPYDRGILAIYYNPNQISRQALRACHISWIVNIMEDRLNLHYTMRSVDYLLGHNIHSYATLMYLLCSWSGFKPGLLSALFMDCHVYESQFDVAEQLLERKPKELPAFSVPKNIDPREWTHDQYILSNYNPRPPIKMPKPVV